MKRVYSIVAVASVWLAGAASAGDAYDYKELQTTELSPIAIVRNADGHEVVDFGKASVGWLELTGEGAGDYEIIIGEMTNEQGRVANPFPGSSVRVQTLKGCKLAREKCRPEMPPDGLNLVGYNNEQSPAILLPPRFGIVFPFRFAEIVSAPVTAAELRQQRVTYPMDLSKSFFHCENEALNRVYEFCRYTIFATSFCGMYTDGDRERTPYEADAYITQMSHYAIDADRSLARKTFEWLMTHPTWPTEWRQLMVSVAWNDMMWSGDTRAVEKFYDQLKTDKLEAGHQFREDGLMMTLDPVEEPRDIVDWPRPERDGFQFRIVNAVVNALYYKNLREMGDIAEALHKDSDAREFRAKAAQVKKSYNLAFRRPDGIYVDGILATNTSLHANAMAMCCGLVDKADQPKIVELLDRKGMICSTYFSQYFLEAFCVAGRADLAVKYMAASGDRSWIGMMDLGTTVAAESWNFKVKPNMDLSHSWSTAPLNIIGRYILGVRPIKPGVFIVDPLPCGLKEIRGNVPR